MRILTVRQPWAWAIIHGGKDVENRMRNLAGSYRGPVAIHVAKVEDCNAFSDINSSTLPALDAAADRWLETLTAKQALRLHAQPWQLNHGAIIGVVDLVDVHRAAGDNPGEVNTCAPFGLCSQWADPTGWHMVITNPRPLPEPIQFKGALGLRRFNDTVDAKILQALQEATS